MKDYTKLQNGSDIRGVAVETEGGPEVNLDKDVAGAIAASFCTWLAKKKNKSEDALTICVGRDSRITGDDLKKGIVEGIESKGASAKDAGLATTPAMFMSTVLPGFGYDGAIMVTASHLPYNRNGFKFFTAGGGLDKKDISEILNTAAETDFSYSGKTAECESVDLMSEYAGYLRSLIKLGLADISGYLEGMHIVVDAGNGAAGLFATEVLEPLGADISGSLYLEPDGMFPNHAANPEDEEAMDCICKATKESGADLGIIFDTDGDRASAVGPGGVPIARNEIVALAAALGAKDNPGGTVVSDSITSDELHEFLEKKLGLKHLRYKRGYRNVIGKAIELSQKGENAFLAIETSGHAAYADNYYLDDGAYLAVQSVISAARLKKKGKNITSLIDGLKSPAESKEVRFKINTEDFKALGLRVLEDFERYVESSPEFEMVKPNYEGVRANFDIDGKKGWILLRLSLHDPVMPLNLESKTEGGCKLALDEMCEFMKNYTELEIPNR